MTEKKLEISNRILFFKYALPCAETLIKRKNLTREKFRKMIKQMAEGREPEKNKENIFKVAMAHLTFLALERKKDKIDDETIREYFLFNHDEAVEERFEEMGDFDSESCRTYPGIVRKIESNRASVETLLGIKPYKKDFVDDLKMQDIVVVHRDFIVEKISKKLASELWELKRKQVPCLGKNIFD
jgi:hydrogenase maturation factor